MLYHCDLAAVLSGDAKHARFLNNNKSCIASRLGFSLAFDQRKFILFFHDLLALLVCGSFFQVRWDDTETSRHSRVSPWEIEPSGPLSSSTSFMAPVLKRSRSGLPSLKPEFPVPGIFGILKKFCGHT